MKNKYKKSRFFKPRIFPNSKKAQLFTILGIFIIFLTFASFEIFSTIHERDVIKTRVSTMDNFMNSIEKNLERQMYISGFRILFLAENEITSSGNYINVNSFFNEAFFNGTVNGISNNSIMNGATYNDLIISLNQKANKINVNITLNNSFINITQNSPWFINFTMTSDFVMKDKENLAKWDKKQVVSALIPVEGFEDPLYTINSYAKVSRKIKRTPYEENYTDELTGNITNLLDHFNKGYYSSNPNAPSFLKRIEGNLSADSNGIESFVKTSDFSSQGIPTQEKTDIDYIYFSTNSPTYFKISGMPSEFSIDNQSNHLQEYNISTLII